MSTKTTTNDCENPSLQELEELHTLRLLRATFHSMKQLFDNIHTDLETVSENYGCIRGLSKRWNVILDAELISGEGKAKIPVTAIDIPGG